MMCVLSSRLRVFWTPVYTCIGIVGAPASVTQQEESQKGTFLFGSSFVTFCFAVYLPLDQIDSKAVSYNVRNNSSTTPCVNNNSTAVVPPFSCNMC